MSAYKRNRGITLGGTKTVYTKGSLAKKKLIAYTKTLNAVTKLAMPVIIQKDVNTFRLAATLLTITGAVVQVPATRKMLMFRLQIASNLATIANAKGANYRIFQHRFCEIISFLKARNKVCYIAVTKNSKITLAKANGEYASIVSKKKGTKKAVVLVRLPSTQLKLIDSLTTVLIGTVIVGQKLLFKNTKAGY